MSVSWASMRAASSLLAVLLLIACNQDDDSNACDVATDEISVVATVVDNGVNIHAEADFGRGSREGPPRVFALCDADDELTIAGEATERTDRTDRVVYSVSLDLGAARAVPFELKRDGQTSVSFTIELAPPFEITAPLPDAEVSRSSELMLTWAPPLDGAELRIGLTEEIGNGICLETTMAAHDYKDGGGVAVADDGNWNIPAEVIEGGTRDRCNASYHLTRFNAVDYPTELHAGGYLEGRVERLVSFLSVP